MDAALPAARLLEARELGARLHPLDRALTVLRLADPGAARDPGELPLAERDARLLTLRRATFGDSIACVADCPRCREATEFSLSASSLLAGLGSVPASETLSVDGWRVTLRALDSRDLAHIAHAADAQQAAHTLVRRAVAHIEAQADAGEPSDILWRTVETRVAEREAAADIAIDLGCPACGYVWTEAFDIGAHLWAELDAAAQRLLQEVVLLARLFGWSEAEILALSPARRQAYLQTAGQLS